MIPAQILCSLGLLASRAAAEHFFLNAPLPVVGQGPFSEIAPVPTPAPAGSSSLSAVQAGVAEGTPHAVIQQQQPVTAQASQIVQVQPQVAQLPQLQIVQPPQLQLPQAMQPQPIVQVMQTPTAPVQLSAAPLPVQTPPPRPQQGQAVQGPQAPQSVPAQALPQQQLQQQVVQGSQVPQSVPAQALPQQQLQQQAVQVPIQPVQVQQLQAAQLQGLLPQHQQQRQAAAAVFVPVSPADNRAALGASSSPLGWLAVEAPKTYQLLQACSFAVVVKFLCMAGNVLVQTSPFQQVKQWEMTRSTGETDAAPYLSIAYGGCQWCIYGFFAYIITGRSGFLILVYSNCLGALLGTFYIIEFYKHCTNPLTRASLHKYLTIVATLVLFQLSMVMQLSHERALFVSGCISSFISFVGGLSMLIMVPSVIRKRDARSIPGPMIFANFISAVLWFICGYMLADPLVAGPNFISTIASGLCIYLKFRFPGPVQNSKYADVAKPERCGFPDPEITMFPKKSRGKAFAAKELSENTPLLSFAGAGKGEPGVWKCGTGGTGGTV